MDKRMEAISLSGKEWDNLTLVQAVDLVQTRQISSETLVKETIRRALARPDLNAFMVIDQVGGLEAAKMSDNAIKSGLPPRPLEGVPVFIKDNIHVRGMVNSAGTPGLRDFIPDLDAPAVEKLRHAGAIILGKTSMHELACGISGYGDFGQTGKEPGIRNAYDSSRIAGGSSSGNGAALGARIVTATLGSDTGGSVRVPAALNGVAALRPTMGRYITEGVTPISRTRDTVGPMAQTVADLELLDRVITGESAVSAVSSLKGLRLGVASFFLQNLDEDTTTFFRKLSQKMVALGIELVDIDMNALTALNDLTGLAIAVYEHHDGLIEYLKTYRPQMNLQELADSTTTDNARSSFVNWVIPRCIPQPNCLDGVSQLMPAGPAYDKAIAQYRPQIQQLYQRHFRDLALDGIIYPTVPCVAVQQGPDASNYENFVRFTQNTQSGSNAGLPSLAIPVGLGETTALSMSLSIDGPHNSDRRLLAIGMALEKQFGRMPAPDS